VSSEPDGTSNRIKFYRSVAKRRGEDEEAVASDRDDIQEKRLPFLVGPYVLEVEIYCTFSPRPGIFIMTRRLEVNIVFCCVTTIEPRRCVVPYVGRRGETINQGIELNVSMKVFETNKNKSPSSAHMWLCLVCPYVCPYCYVRW
jgi:hypothetical protein